MHVRFFLPESGGGTRRIKSGRHLMIKLSKAAEVAKFRDGPGNASKQMGIVLLVSHASAVGILDNRRHAGGPLP